jgi:hypothetical protein
MPTGPAGRVQGRSWPESAKDSRTTGCSMPISGLSGLSSVLEYKHLQPGFVLYYDAIRSQGWTDTKPAGLSAQLPPGY